MKITPQQRFRGLLLGLAVGDSVGLPMEGISASRIKKLNRGQWRHALFLGKGWCSDDTEHAFFVSQSLLKHPKNARKFSQRLAWQLRWWLLALPAGVGLATAKSILRLWVGFKPQNSGVFSAGNGAAMRVAPIAAFFADEKQHFQHYIQASTVITHSDPKALTGALAVADCIRWVIQTESKQAPDLSQWIPQLGKLAPLDEDWQALITTLKQGLQQQLSVKQFVESLGLKEAVTGYVYHTVPVVLFAWHRHYGDFQQTLTSVWACGGDVDTTGAIVGAMAGVVTGEKAIPSDWLANLAEWPRDVNLLIELADRLQLAKQKKQAPVRYFWLAVLPRNLFFLVVVLGHGFRRLLPPY